MFELPIPRLITVTVNTPKVKGIWYLPIPSGKSALLSIMLVRTPMPAQIIEPLPANMPLRNKLKLS